MPLQYKEPGASWSDSASGELFQKPWNLLGVFVIAVAIGGWFVLMDASTASAKGGQKRDATTGKSERAPAPSMEAMLTDAPLVPPPVKRKQGAKLIVELEVTEVNLPISDGVEYTFWTFGGKIPGKFIRVRQGDTVEFHLLNHAESRFPHNIDLHAVTGPGGGAASSNTPPGHRTQFTFMALNPGLYVYHCATAPGASMWRMGCTA